MDKKELADALMKMARTLEGAKRISALEFATEREFETTLQSMMNELNNQFKDSIVKFVVTESEYIHTKTGAHYTATVTATLKDDPALDTKDHPINLARSVEDIIDRTVSRYFNVKGIDWNNTNTIFWFMKSDEA